MKKETQYILLIVFIVGIVALVAMVLSMQGQKDVVGKAGEPVCTDSDGGDNKGVRGTTYGKNPNTGTWERKTDTCSSGKQCEFYCGANNKWVKDCQVCPTGVCSNGACPQCADSDPTNDLRVKGNIRGYHDNGTFFAREDRCGTNIQLRNVYDHYCNLESEWNYNYLRRQCPEGFTCSDGVCVCTNNECPYAGAKRCSSIQSFYECGDYDNNGCLEWKRDTESCPLHKNYCIDGDCVSSLNCKDTDNGIKPLVAGQVTVKGDSNVYKDLCLDSNRKIKEFYCSNDAKAERILSCSNTCALSNGMAYCRVSGTATDDVCNVNEDCRNSACRCADKDFCGKKADGTYTCKDCSRNCDGKCPSSDCYGTDPDCNKMGNKKACCGDNVCEGTVEIYSCMEDCPWTGGGGGGETGPGGDEPNI